MIRTNYPIHPLLQIRLRLALAARRTRRALEERRRALRAEAALRRAAQAEYFERRRQEDTVRERRQYESFFDQYDALNALLCIAAQEGVTPALESRYAQRRRELRGMYPQVKSRVSRFLAEPHQETSLPPRRRDDFELLFAANQLRTILDEDGGHLIGRLIRTQDALACWEAAIRRQERDS